MIEQAESLNSELLNGLFYSLGGLNKEISILLCLRMFTKRATFTSALSRRVLSSLHMRCFSLSTSTDLFDRLAYAVLLNPSFTHLKLEPELTKYLRSSFFRDNFSVSYLKKCLRFALLQHLWFGRKSEREGDASMQFSRDVNQYFKALTFLQRSICRTDDCKEGGETPLLRLHEDVQRGGFSGKICCSSEYKYWLQSLRQMCREEFNEMLQREEFLADNVRLPEDLGTECPETIKQGSQSSFESVTSILQLKEKMKERIAQSQRNPDTLLRQKAIQDIEKALRAVLRPMSSFSHFDGFLFGESTVPFLAPDMSDDVEQSLAKQSTSVMSTALDALLKQGRWKTVTFVDWGRTFAANCISQDTTENSNLEQMFFASVGQLELMGIIRGSADHENPTVTIAHHVLSAGF